MSPHAVIIGAGMGGLTSARILQKRGYRVTVLEQHYRPGGFLHRFFRNGRPYDTGFHYCGSVAPGQPLGQALRHLGVFDDLDFHALDPSGFDRLQYPDFEFRVPSGFEAYRERLKTTFTDDAVGIDALCDDLLEAVEAFRLYRMDPTPAIEQVLRVESLRLSDLVDTHIRDPRCKAVLSGQSVLYGVPPWESPVGMHALVMHHFLSGATTIRGGGDALAMAMTRAIRRDGGTVRLKTEVNRVECDGRVAQAVHTTTGERIEADLVISNLHPRLTLQLLPDQATRKAYRTKVGSQRVGHAHIGVYLELDGPIPEIGNANIYRHMSWDPAESYDAATPDKVPMYFANAPSEHRPTPDDKGVILMLAPMEWDQVSQWAGTPTGDRPEAYTAYKQAVTDNVVRALVADNPTLADRITRVESSTPLTTQHYTRSPNGATYGHWHGVGQMGRYRPSQLTRVRNLVLVGQGVFSPGVLGTTLSAYYAVGHLLGMDDLCRELRDA